MYRGTRGLHQLPKYVYGVTGRRILDVLKTSVISDDGSAVRFDPLGLAVCVRQCGDRTASIQCVFRSVGVPHKQTSRDTFGGTPVPNTSVRASVLGLCTACVINREYVWSLLHWRFDWVLSKESVEEVLLRHRRVGFTLGGE